MQRRDFPLTSLLKIRKGKEALEERALAALRGEVERTRGALAQLALAAQDQAEKRAAEKQEVSSSTHHLIRAARWRDLCAQEAHLKKQLELLQARAHEQQVLFLEARRQRETVSELHEKYVKTRTLAQNIAERKLVEDLFSSRHREVK